MAGAKSCDFVDQGDFEIEIANTLEMNKFNSRGRFHRSDVFKFLDSAQASNQKYDLILCDPPAFAKSSLQKKQALEGYTKLHRKVFKIAAKDSFSSFFLPALIM